MINNTGAEYLFIRACVLFLDNILTAATIYCTLAVGSLFLPSLRHLCCLPKPVLAWFLTEIAFHFLIFRPRLRSFREDAVHPELLPRAERRKLFERCHNNIPDPEAYLRKWFGNARPQDIRRENVKEFLRWAFLDTREVRDKDEEEIEEYTLRTEEMLGRALTPGWGTGKSLRLTLDEVKYGNRSFLWHMCIAVVDTIASTRLWLQGFQLYRLPHSQFFKLFPLRPLVFLSKQISPAAHSTYWYRPHKSKTRSPVLFIHGIGIGLYPYTKFLDELARNLADEVDGENGEVGIIALEIMPISFRLTHDALSKDTMTSEIHSILKQHGWEKVVLVTHSYGSTVATHLIKSPLTQSMICSMVLIDPITFLLHLPDVAHNFTVRKPVLANEHQLWYFASQDPGVAHTLGRRFFWSENIMWAEDLRQGADGGRRAVTVVMAGRDLIVDTKTVSRYLLSSDQELDNSDWKTSGGLNGHAKVAKSYFGTSPDRTDGNWKSGPWKGDGFNLLWLEHLDHAQVFDSPKSRRLVAQTIKQYAAAN